MSARSFTPPAASVIRSSLALGQLSSDAVSERRDLVQLGHPAQFVGVVGDEQPDQDLAADDRRVGLIKTCRRYRGRIIQRVPAVAVSCDLRGRAVPRVKPCWVRNSGHALRRNDHSTKHMILGPLIGAEKPSVPHTNGNIEHPRHFAGGQ